MKANEFINKWKQIKEIIADDQYGQLISDLNQVNANGIQIAFTFSYCYEERSLTPHLSIEIGLGKYPYDIYIWNISEKGERDDLYCQLSEELDDLDLSEGADDQYFDYNPSTLEACLFLHWMLTTFKAPGYKEYHLENDIKKTFEDFFQFCHDEDRDDDEMLPSYEAQYQEFVKDTGYQEVSCGWDDLKKHSFHSII